ncbi:MAG: nitroreductase family protein [Oscillospiraceae bacterium]|nr:nitroreductase family protein [Oscillospiraceae bacterium]
MITKTILQGVPDNDRSPNETIRTRRRAAGFAEHPVSRDILETLVKCGIYAPSGHNMQTWRFTVLEGAASIQTLETLVRRNNAQFPGFRRPAALILLSNDRRNPYGVQDCSCAAQNILLAARSLGLDAELLNPLTAICDEPEIRAMLRSYDMPDEHIVQVCVALGYSAQRRNA